MKMRVIGLLVITLLITTQQLVNCQSSSADDDNDGGDGGRSFEGDVEEPSNSGSGGKKVTEGDAMVDDRKKQTEAKLVEQEDLRPRSHFTEDRFTQLFVPRNSRRKLVSARYTTKPKPTLPSFIKKPISVPPPDFETPSPRGSSSQSSSRSSSSRTTTTTTTTPRPGRGRGRGGGSTSTTTTTTTESSYRRGIFSTRKPSTKLFPTRNRN